MKYVPQLRRNLVLLGVLNSLGYSIRIDNGSMKVNNGSLVVLKEKRVNSLYILLGRVDNDNYSVASIQNDDFSFLWHNKLGHVNEKVLIYLFKQGVLRDNL